MRNLSIGLSPTTNSTLQHVKVRISQLVSHEDSRCADILQSQELRRELIAHKASGVRIGLCDIPIVVVQFVVCE